MRQVVYDNPPRALLFSRNEAQDLSILAPNRESLSPREPLRVPMRRVVGRVVPLKGRAARHRRQRPFVIFGSKFLSAPWN